MGLIPEKNMLFFFCTYTLKTFIFEIALVSKSSLCWNFCVAKRQTLYGKTGHHTKAFVEKNTNLPTQAQF
jgi:hypothetical protein